MAYRYRSTDLLLGFRKVVIRTRGVSVVAREKMKVKVSREE